MPEKIINTLTSSILKSIYTLISFIFFYKLYFIIIFKYSKFFLLKNHIYIIIFILDL